MTENQGLNVLEAITDQKDIHTSIIFSYGANLAFYETCVLHPLWQDRCRNNLVFLEADRYVDTISDFQDSVTWAGRRYVLVPVNMGMFKSFHSKLILLLGVEKGRLLIGSGNLTFNGYGANHEVFTVIDWSPEDNGHQYIFNQCWQLIQKVQERWGYSVQAHKMLWKAETQSTWIKDNNLPNNSEEKLFSTFDESLIDQMGSIFDGEVIRTIKIITPFLDNNVSALAAIYQKFQPEELHLILQNKKAVGNRDQLSGLLNEGIPIKIYPFMDDERYLHAKIYIFATQNTEYALIGSGNCTGAAWLNDIETGNFETMLLKKGSEPDYFHSLLDGRVESQPISSLEEIELEKYPPTTKTQRSGVRLLDASIKSVELTLRFEIVGELDGNLRLVFVLSTIPPLQFDIINHLQGENLVTLTLKKEHLTYINNIPVSGQLLGLNGDGECIEIGCNSLWINNINILSRRGGTIPIIDIDTGGYLEEMLVESDEQWKELYRSLITLVNLDVKEVQKTKSTTGKQPEPSTKAGENGKGSGKEIGIRLVGDDIVDEEYYEITAEIYQESQFYAWLQYIRGRLPGKEKETPVERTPPEVKRRYPRKPSISVGKSFLNLVRKYIRSLGNQKYMETAPVFHILAYYNVFQRIIWLLYTSKVINLDKFLHFSVQINRGLFGDVTSGSPVFSPHIHRIIRREWRQAWLDEGTALYALASAWAAYDYSDRIRSEEADSEVELPVSELPSQLDIQILSCVATVADVWVVLEDADTRAEVANVYDLQPENLWYELDHFVGHHMREITDNLRLWLRNTTLAMAETEDDRQLKILRRARVDYCIALYQIFQSLSDTESQVKTCSDLIFLADRAGDDSTVQKYQDKLIELLREQGHLDDLSNELFSKGRDAFFDQEYEEAGNCLRQAILIAEQTEDIDLLRLCNQYLEWISYFLK